MLQHPEIKTSFTHIHRSPPVCNPSTAAIRWVLSEDWLKKSFTLHTPLAAIGAPKTQVCQIWSRQILTEELMDPMSFDWNSWNFPYYFNIL